MAEPIVLTGFAGSASAKKPRLLDEHVGVNVVDAEPGIGDLRPLHDRLTVVTLSVLTQQHTIFRLREGAANEAEFWLSWTAAGVSVARNLDADDTTERVYYTGSGTPKWTDNVIGLGSPPYPQASRELSVPAPDAQPILSLTTDGTGTDGTRYYVSTFVNDLGWESAPSPISDGLVCKEGAIVAISSLPAPPSGNYGITLRRIYRTQPGTTAGAASFFFLREIAVGATSTTDDARALGDVLATAGWRPLPSTAFGLVNLWNGMLAALDGKALLFSVPSTPYAWPVGYAQNITDKPVALAKWDQNLLVLTVGKPRIFNGQDPTTMSETPFRVSFACSSAPSVVEFGHGVVWASKEGLAYTGSEVLITSGIITPKQWKTLNPDTMIAGRWRSLYVCSYDSGGGGRKGLMFDPLNPQLGIWFLSTGFDACWYDELADELYVLEGAAVRKFDGATAKLTATFRSKVFRQVAPRNFGFGKVVAESYPVTVKVWADGVLKCNRSVTNEFAFALVPANFRAHDWQVEVSAADSVEAVHLAADIRDLRSR